MAVPVSGARTIAPFFWILVEFVIPVSNQMFRPEHRRRQLSSYGFAVEYRNFGGNKKGRRSALFVKLFKSTYA